MSKYLETNGVVVKRVHCITVGYSKQHDKVFCEAFLHPLYTGGLIQCYMLNESICCFRGVGVYFVTFVLFLMENPVSKQCRP